MENNLTSRDAAAASLAYDGRGRLASVVAGTATTQFAYDEGRVVGEFNGAGAMLRRYVPEAGVWYEGSGVSDRRWMLADERGSIMAVTNGAGTTATIDTYDEYGVPGAANAGRFQYTGQMWIAELGLYHYNARAYSPALGRFMQTDPIGYMDGPNWYEYVGDDPVDHTDPTGQFCFFGFGDCSPPPPPPPSTKVSEVVVTAHRPAPPPPSNNAVIVVGVRIATLPDWLAGSLAVPNPVWGVLGLASVTLCGDSPSSCGPTKHTMQGDRAKPPPGSKPISETPWSGDHQGIKGAIGAGPADDVRISPDGHVWGEEPDGSWTDHGPAGDYTGSGKPSGQRGSDR